MAPVTVRISDANFRLLHQHLFPGDGDEHAAILVCGVVTSARGTRLLVREVVLARDDVDFVRSRIAYKELTARFVARNISRCADENLCYVAVHNHGGRDSVDFSDHDWDSHEQGYPALLNIAHGGPVGALVFAENAVAGDIWFADRSRQPVESLTVIGPQIRVLRPKSTCLKSAHADLYDRNIRLLGDEGQAILQGLKVTVIGLGGGGSLLNEWLARLGVGEIVAVDPDIIEDTNRPRVVDATKWDVFRKRAKVKIAERVAKRANPNIRFHAMQADVRDEKMALLAADSDAVFLAGDNFTTRNIFNALVHQYLIPGFHVGVGIEVSEESRKIVRVKVESRVVLPQPRGGCLRCEGLIPPAKLQLESLKDEQRRAQGYLGGEGLDEVPSPSVISLNVLSTGQAVTDLMMMFTGLYPADLELFSSRQMALERQWRFVKHREPDPCRFCSVLPKSVYARGDRAELPCRTRAARPPSIWTFLRDRLGFKRRNRSR